VPTKRLVWKTLCNREGHSFDYDCGNSIGMVVENTPDTVQSILYLLQKHQQVASRQKVLIDQGYPVTLEEVDHQNIDL
jgi:hypothetical protein